MCMIYELIDFVPDCILDYVDSFFTFTKSDLDLYRVPVSDSDSSEPDFDDDEPLPF